MELIRKTGTKSNKSGNLISFGEFLCSFCNKIAIKQLSHGKRQKSCGCIIIDRQGESYTRLYQTYSDIKHRCLSDKRLDYRNYGGRGITICPEWLNDYIMFRDWALSNGYNDSLTIDRIKNDGGYFPENCRWVTRTEQNRNQRRVKLTLGIANYIRDLYKTGGFSYRVLAKKYGVDRSMIYLIIKNKKWKNVNE